MSKSKDFISDLPPWAKGFVAVAVVAGVGVTAYLIYSEIKKARVAKDSKKENNEAVSVAAQLQKSGVKPTMDDLQLANSVNGIKTAWLNYDVITREHVQPFYRELAKISNDLDMVNMIKKYGIQTIDFPVAKFTANDFTGNLTQSAKNFLNNSEIKAANDMLARKGLKYRF